MKVKKICGIGQICCAGVLIGLSCWSISNNDYPLTALQIIGSIIGLYWGLQNVNS